MERGLVNLNDLLVGERVFEIPLYQRQYAWEERQLDDLWNDLIYLDPGKKHFFGTVLMKDTGQKKKAGITTFKVSQIIDGQQRIVTTLILLREVLEQLQALPKSKITPKEIRKLREDYLKYKNVYKMELLGDDAEFFRKNIIDGKEYPVELLTPSRRRLYFAREFYKKKLEQAKEEKTNPEFRNFLLDLKEKIGGLDVIRYAVEKDEDAVLIFETVNDRGKQLSKLEKTKSFLMHTVYLCTTKDSTTNLERVNEHFMNIYRYLEQICNTERGEDLDVESIQRYHFIIYETDEKEVIQDYFEYLKKKVRSLYNQDKAKCLKYVLDYSEDLEKSFFALKEIVEYSNKDEMDRWLMKFFVLGRVANFLPLLLAIWIKTKRDKEKLTDILKVIESISFRTYAVGGKRADKGASSLYQLANAFYKGGLSTKAATELAIDWMAPVSDAVFEKNLRAEDFEDETAHRDIKYLFFEYETFLRAVKKEPLEIDVDKWISNKFEIEHIWADKAKVPSSLKKVHEKCKGKLGNLTVASKSWNASWGNKDFVKKRPQYAKSVLRVQRQLSKNKKWGKKQIKEREDEIVTFASHRWAIPKVHSG